MAYVVPSLATAPQFALRDKRKLFNTHDGSVERSHVFPVPYTLTFPDKLVQSVGRSLRIACAHGTCGPDAERLSVASHPAITRDARTAKVTPFRERFQCETRSIKLVIQDIFHQISTSQHSNLNNCNNL
jgi:hypothetical protein